MTGLIFSLAASYCFLHSNNLKGPSVVFRHQHLLPRPLLSRLRLHLLHFQRVQAPPPHKQVMVPDAQLEDLDPDKNPHGGGQHLSTGRSAGFQQVNRLGLTNLLTLCREELNLKTFAFLSSGLMVN